MWFWLCMFGHNELLLVFLKAVFAEEFYEPGVADNSSCKLLFFLFSDYQLLNPLITDGCDEEAIIF